MILRYALLDILRDRNRFLLTIVGIGIGVAQFVALFSFSTGLEDEFTRAMSGFFNKVIVTPRQSVSKYLDQETIDTIAEYGEVTQIVRKRTVSSLYASNNQGVFITTTFIDRDRVLDEITLARGTVSGAIIGQKALGKLKAIDPELDVGAELRLVLPRHGNEVITTTIGGVLAEEGLVLGSMSFDWAVVLPMEMVPEERYDLILVRVDRLENMKTIADRIETELSLDAISFENSVREVINLTDTFNYAFFLISFIAILIASMSTINTMMITVIERTREIGILKALGFTRAEVVSIFVLESLFIGVLGSVIGCLIGIGMSRTLVTMLISRTGFNIVPVIDSTIIVLSIIVGTLIACLSGALPAKQAGDLDPLDALAAE